MKLRHLVIAALAAGFAVNGVAASKDQGHGQIKFTGSIIDAPCSITPDSSNQTVYLGQVSNLALKDGGKSTPVSFQIDLEKCDTQTLKNVTATFTGAKSSGNVNMLGITGSAKGASIALTDGSGTLIKLGQPTAAQAIVDGSNTLAFSAYLQGDMAADGKAGAEIIPGEFSSIANYALSYQ